MNVRIRDVLLGIGLTLAGVAFAQSITRNLNLTINGKPVSSKAVVIQNQNYVPVNALTALGIKSSLTGNTLALSSAVEGGANQISALEGCLGETLFNGMLRVKISELVRLETLGITQWNGFKGWALNAEFKNGTNERLSPFDMGLNAAPTIVRASGSLLSADTTGLGTRDWSKVRDVALLPGASVVHQIKFIDDESAPEALPSKLILQIDTTKVKPKINAKYTIKDPSFRFNLTCQK